MRTRPAVVITTYNQPRLLELCLESFCNQTVSAFDLYIADDGSGPETRVVIDRYRARLNRDIHHFWHPDVGYRKSTINNRVFAAIDPSVNSVVICIDHDVILHRRFIEDHVWAHSLAGFSASRETLFMGRRIDLGPSISASLKVDEVCEFNLGLSCALVRSWLRGETKLISRAVHLRPGFFAKLLKRGGVADLLGSNFSITTALLQRINGYNEDYKSYWGEDGDLFVRARNAGANCYGWKGFAIQYHMDHPRLEPSKDHQQRYAELLQRTDYVRCERGISSGS